MLHLFPKSILNILIPMMLLHSLYFSYYLKKSVTKYIIYIIINRLSGTNPVTLLVQSCYMLHFSKFTKVYKTYLTI